MTHKNKKKIYLEVEANPNCSLCHGTGTYREERPWGSTVAYEPMTCTYCVDYALEDLTEEQEACDKAEDCELVIEILPSHA
jgi:DnaJ-class molecular chaperone